MNESPYNLAGELQALAAKYETREFIEGDPSWFMHQVKGEANMEAAAFVASSLSFGSRKQFMPRIAHIVFDLAGGEVDGWIRSRAYAQAFPETCQDCFYRFYKVADMRRFFDDYNRLMSRHGSLREYVKANCRGDGYLAVKAICSFFDSPPVPKDATSACKRVCMFLRWMVRDSSPVDLGLWKDIIDKRTLLMPLDTHVIQQSQRLGLVEGKGSAGMSCAKRLTAKLAGFFPSDPLRADFALFGYGVNNPADGKILRDERASARPAGQIAKPLRGTRRLAP